MRALCAWCGVELKSHEPQDADESSRQTTHGICQSCAQYFFSPHDRSLRGFLNTFKTPVVVVDDDMRALEANGAALAAVGKTREAVIARFGGDVIGCANARLPGGCGRTEDCKACTIRNSVRKAFETGVGCSRVPAWIRLHDETEAQAQKMMRVLISTEKAGYVVLLRLDEITR